MSVINNTIQKIESNFEIPEEETPINLIPSEILQYIFSFTPDSQDFSICKYWTIEKIDQSKSNKFKKLKNTLQHLKEHLNPSKYKNVISELDTFIVKSKILNSKNFSEINNFNKNERANIENYLLKNIDVDDINNLISLLIESGEKILAEDLLNKALDEVKSANISENNPKKILKNQKNLSQIGQSFLQLENNKMALDIAVSEKYDFYKLPLLQDIFDQSIKSESVEFLEKVIEPTSNQVTNNCFYSQLARREFNKGNVDEAVNLVDNILDTMHQKKLLDLFVLSKKHSLEGSGATDANYIKKAKEAFNKGKIDKAIKYVDKISSKKQRVRLMKSFLKKAKNETDC